MNARGTAVVTGASRGIGRGVAIELARRGFDVVATMRDPSMGADIDEEVGDRADRGQVSLARLDVKDPDSIRLPGELSVLVNNAGSEGDYLPIEHADIAQWRDMIETNVIGLVEVTKRAIPGLRASGRGVICNIGSSAILVPVPFYGAYRASKAALSSISETLRAELGSFGIRVVEVLPGPIATDMLAKSDRMPEAHRFADYRSMAERAYAGRQRTGSLTVSVEEAATLIADAVEDDDAPMRVGCDPMSIGMLDAWRATDDEAWMRSLLDAQSAD